MTQYKDIAKELSQVRDELFHFTEIADRLQDSSIFGLLFMRQGTFGRLLKVAHSLDELDRQQPPLDQFTLEDVKLRSMLPSLVFDSNRLLRQYLAQEAGLCGQQGQHGWDGCIPRSELTYLVQTLRKAEQQKPQPCLFDQDLDYLELPYQNQVRELSQKCIETIGELHSCNRSIATITLVLCRHIEQLSILNPLSTEQHRTILQQLQEVWCQHNAEAMERWRGQLEYSLTGNISTQATTAQWQQAFAKMKQDWTDTVKQQASASPSASQMMRLQICQFLLKYEYPGNSYSLQSRDIVEAIIRLIVMDGIDLDELFSLMERYNTIVRIIRRSTSPSDPKQEQELKFRHEVLSVANKARQYWDDTIAPVETFDLIWNDWLDNKAILLLMHSKSPSNIGLNFNFKLILNLTGILMRKLLVKVAQTKLAHEMHPDGKRCDTYLINYEDFGTKDTEFNSTLLTTALSILNNRLNNIK